jgi:HAD superfamily hydrolase (TIGR01509 family)
MPKAVLFDVDGTLVDSNNYHVLAWAEAFHAAGHDFRLSELHRHIGKGADNYVQALLPNASDDEAKALGEAHGRLFRQHYAHRLKPFLHARELLARCRDAGLLVMLATSASAKELERHLDVLDARGLVDGWSNADDVGCSKPCPDVFETVLRKADVVAGDAVAVGDTPYDIEAARGAGVKTIALRSGLFSDEDLAGAIAIYDDTADLLARFDESPLSA